MQVAALYRGSAVAAFRPVWRVGCATTSGLEARFGCFGWMSKIDQRPQVAPVDPLESERNIK
jgi:hypothetical protein